MASKRKKSAPIKKAVKAKMSGGKKAVKKAAKKARSSSIVNKVEKMMKGFVQGAEGAAVSVIDAGGKVVGSSKPSRAKRIKKSRNEG